MPVPSTLHSTQYSLWGCGMLDDSGRSLAQWRHDSRALVWLCNSQIAQIFSEVQVLMGVVVQLS